MVIFPLSKGVLIKFRQMKQQNDLNILSVACKEFYASYGHWPEQMADLQPFLITPVKAAGEYSFEPSSQYMLVQAADSDITVVRPQNKSFL